MWMSVQVELGSVVHRGRCRVDDGVLTLEWSGGRHQERCGLLKPEFVATTLLRKLAAGQRIAA